MKYPSRKVIALAIVVTLALPFVFLGRNKPSAPAMPASFAPPSTATTNDAQTKQQVQAKLNKLPLSFIENKGQLDARVAFYVQGSDKTLYFTSQGITYALTETTAPPPLPATPDSLLHPAAFRPEATTAQPQKRYVVKLDFLGANPHVKPKGELATGATVNYFKGQQADWKTGLKTYAKIVYEELWPGIDLEYSGTVNQMKYQFIVKPGADPQQIRLAYRGASSVKRNAQGQLDVITPAGTMQDDAPYAYQEEGGQRVEVKAAYALEKKTNTKSQEYGFEVGAYDKRKPIVLDPAVLVYCGYIGGGSNDLATGIAVDSAGYAYVTGDTQSAETSFPVTVGPDLIWGNRDAFVAKVKADGTGLVYCGYIGGSNQDFATSIAVDTTGNAYVAGFTLSNQGTFPATVGPDLTFNSRGDGFIAKVKADGTGLVYCGYIGGGEYEMASGIALDAAGNAYITGFTESNATSAFPFPVTVGPILTHKGLSDAFVAKVKADGTGFAYCGYIGGAGGDAGNSIAVDAGGNAYVTGRTVFSNETSFPVIVGPDLTYNGNDEAFVAKVKADGSGLAYCGYIGGSSYDDATGITVDAAGNAYIAGVTVSDQTTFPVTIGPDLTFNNKNELSLTDAFVAKVKADGTGLVYCGYIGGAGEDRAYGIAVDATGNAYITGYTNSDQTSFPVITGPDLTYNLGYNDTLVNNAFVAKVKTDGTGLVYCGYLGSNAYGQGIAIEGTGNAYVTGYTYADQTLFPVSIGPDVTFNGVRGQADAFVAKISAYDPTCNAIITTQPQSQTILRGQTASLSVAPLGTAPFTYQWYEGDTGNTTKPVGTNAATFTTPALTSNTHYWVRVSNACNTADSDTTIITVTSNLEADLAPRPFGNGSVTIADWTQAGRIVAGLDTPEAGHEFQRADCAPRDTKGDGKLSLADWVQAGRYAVGLDPTATVGGPTQKSAAASVASAAGTEATTRTLRARTARFSRGQIGVLAIELDGGGNENAVSFSLNFDPRQMSFVEAVVGEDATGAALQIQRAQAAQGRLAFALALPPGQQWAAGTRTLLNLRFIPNGGEGEAVTSISFSDQLLAREIVDANASPLPQVAYASGTITISGSAAAHVSAASYLGAELAADSIASAFGMKLATMTVGAINAPLPNTLGGTSVKVKDSLGVERAAALFFVSPNQINYQIPAGTAEGIATVKITNSAGEVTPGLLSIGNVAPGIFAADASGQGWAAADVVYVKSDQSQVLERVARFDAVQNKFVPVPIDLSTDAVVLVLYGTGIRHRANLAKVTVKIGSIQAVVDYADQQGQYIGLDQINVRVPKSLAGRGMVDVEVEVEGKPANPIRVAIK